ncbi:MAG: LPS export ABC transporter permease LptF [Alphaproteobacteria bacterium]|nr:LPS export ABC transporter permease LptF [Alphaproteobacteria bacterium]
MRKLNSYIFKQIAIGVLFVSFSLTAVLWLTQSLRFIQLIMGKGLSIGKFVHLTMLMLPGFFVVLLPISLFVVVMFVYNRMELDRELIVMRSVGMNNKEIAKPAMMVGLVSMLVGYFLTLYLVPTSYSDFKEMQWSIRHDVSHVLIREGEFNNVVKGVTVYIKKRTNEGELIDLFVHDKRKPNRPITLMAESGKLLYTDRGPRIIMVNGNQQEVTENGSKLSTLYFEEYTFDFGALEGTGGLRSKDPRERSLVELFELSEGDEVGVGETQVKRFRVEGYKRLLLPLQNLLMVLIAICGLLTSRFSRRGQTKRLIWVTGVMILVQAAALGAENVASKNVSFIPLMYVVNILPILFCLHLLFSKTSVAISGNNGVTQE